MLSFQQTGVFSQSKHQPEKNLDILALWLREISQPTKEKVIKTELKEDCGYKTKIPPTNHVKNIRSLGSILYLLICSTFHVLFYFSVLSLEKLSNLLFHSKQTQTILHYITLHYNTLHYIIIHYITLYCIILHYITLYCIILHYITLYYVTLHCTTLYYNILRYITLCHVISRYITLYYIMNRDLSERDCIIVVVCRTCGMLQVKANSHAKMTIIRALRMVSRLLDFEMGNVTVMHLQRRLCLLPIGALVRRLQMIHVKPIIGRFLPDNSLTVPPSFPWGLMLWRRDYWHNVKKRGTDCCKPLPFQLMHEST